MPALSTYSTRASASVGIVSQTSTRTCSLNSPLRSPDPLEFWTQVNATIGTKFARLDSYFYKLHLVALATDYTSDANKQLKQDWIVALVSYFVIVLRLMKTRAILSCILYAKVS